MSKLIKNVKDLRLLAVMNGTVPLTDELCNHIKLGGVKFKGLTADANASMLNHSTAEEFILSDIKMCTGLTDSNGDGVDVIYYPVNSREELGLYAILLCLYKDGPMTVGYLYNGGHVITDSIQYNQQEWLTVDKNWKYAPVSLLNATKLRRHVTNNEVLIHTLRLTGYLIHTTSSRYSPTLTEDLLYYNNTPAVNVRTGEMFTGPAVSSAYGDGDVEYSPNDEDEIHADGIHFNTVSNMAKVTEIDCVIDFFANKLQPLTDRIEEVVKNQDHSIREQKYNYDSSVLHANDNHDKLANLIHHTHQTVMHSVIGLETKMNQLLSSRNLQAGYMLPLGQRPNNSHLTHSIASGLSPDERNAILNLQETVLKLTKDSESLRGQIVEIKNKLDTQDKVIATLNGTTDGATVVEKATNLIDGLLED